MRIGVDATSWVNPRGYGRFTRELLREMLRAAPEDEFLFFVERGGLDRAELDAKNLRVVEVDLGRPPSEAASSEGYRSPRDLLAMTRAVRGEEMEVFFSPTVYTYFPLPLGLAAVVTVHDAIAERFPELTLPSARARLFWRLKVKLALWQSRLVLTVSEFARREIVEVLGIDDGRVRVACEAPAKEYGPTEPAELAAVAARYGLDPAWPWFVYVGGFNPHKRLDVLVEAHARVAAKMGEAGLAPAHLLLVGKRSGDVFHGEAADVARQVERLGTGELVHWTDFVPDEDLAHLHSHALGLVLVSEAEGFGLPAVEAAACGAPVVATTRSPLPELLEGGGLFLDPGDVDGLASALERLGTQEEERRAFGRRALERARALSWERAAEAALGCLREACA